MQFLGNFGKTEISIIDVYGSHTGNCGYCDLEKTKTKKTSSSFGFSCEKYDSSLYEQMMLKGWRRCGDYTYKFDLEKTCCKAYTCRLNIDEFKMNKKQRQVMRRFRKYLTGELEEELSNKYLSTEKINEVKKKEINDNYLKEINIIVQNYITQECYKEIINQYGLKKQLTEIHKANTLRNKNRKFGDYSNNIFILLFNEILVDLKQGKREKLFLDLFNNFSKFFGTVSQHEMFSISLSQNTGHLNFIVNAKEEYEKFINLIKQNHNQQTQKTKENTKYEYISEYFPELITDPPIYLPLKHTYTVELDKNISSNNEKFAVYKKYQMNVHKDPEEKLKNSSSYNHAWGSTNLKGPAIKLPKDLSSKTPHPELYPDSYGTYNFIHRIDGKIIAVGVWDILPTSLSSVYLYYDTDYSFLDLGVFTAIKEIEYMKSFQKLIDVNFKYYVMGFYIDTCQKMRYKGEYQPTQLLDPVTYNYVYLDQVKDIIKDGKYHQLSQQAKDPNFIFDKGEIDKIYNELPISLHVKGRVIKEKVTSFINNYINEQYKKKLENIMKEFIELVGKKVIREIDFQYSFSRY